MSWETLRWAREQRTNNVAMQCVLFVIADAADPDGVAFRWWNSKGHWWSYIAERTGMAKGSIYRTIGQLEELGLLSREQCLPPGGARTQHLVRLDLTKFVALPRPRAPMPPQSLSETKDPASASDRPHMNSIETEESKPVVDESAKFDASGLACALMRIAGLDPDDKLAFPIGWCGVRYRCQMWLDRGWKADICLDVARALMRRKPDGPPETPHYFEKAIANRHKSLGAPIPQGDAARGSRAPSRRERLRSFKEQKQERWCELLDRLGQYAHGPQESGGPRSPAVRVLSKNGGQ